MVVAVMALGRHDGEDAIQGVARLLGDEVPGKDEGMRGRKGGSLPRATEFLDDTGVEGADEGDDAVEVVEVEEALKNS